MNRFHTRRWLLECGAVLLASLASLPQPVIQSVQFTEAGTTLKWSSQPGQFYVVQYTTSLSDAAWLNLVELQAQGPALQTTDHAIGPAQKFYRILLRPGGEEPAPRFDLGIAPSYEVSFTQQFDFGRLAQEGLKRVNLYYTFKELDIGLRDPRHPEGTDWAEEIDPIMNQLQALGLRACFIIELTHTDCPAEAPESCWLEFGLPRELLYDASGKFAGFNQDKLAGRVENAVLKMAQRYSPEVLTHILVGNETDQYLRLHGHAEDFKELLARVNRALQPVANRPKFGTIYTFAPDSDLPQFNDLAREIVPAVEVMAFTIYPYLPAAIQDQTIKPAAELISKWFDNALEIAGDKPLVVTETAHPGGGNFGSDADQAAYVRFLLDYLKGREDQFDFITWWCLEDADTHPFPGFRHTGLKTNNEESKRSAYDLWTEASE